MPLDRLRAAARKRSSSNAGSSGSRAMCDTWNGIRRRQAASGSIVSTAPARPAGAPSIVGSIRSIAIDPKVRWSTNSSWTGASGAPSRSVPGGWTSRTMRRWRAAGRSRPSRICPLMPRWATSASGCVSSPCTASSLQREPHELATADGGGDRPTGQAVREVLGRAVVPGEGTLVEHLHVQDPRTGDRGFEARADDLDLGEFGHLVRPRRCARTGVSRRRARPTSRRSSCSSRCRWRCPRPAARRWRGRSCRGPGRPR